MEAKKHYAYKEEAKHLESTKLWIKEEYHKLIEQDTKLSREIVALRKEVSTVFDERLILKTQMQEAVHEEEGNLERVEHSPYFGRINFKEKYKDEQEIIYIGKFGLYDSERGEMLVLDWRAPMSNIYYSGMDEEVAYRTPSGVVEGRMNLKRRYVLSEGKLAEIHDEKSLQDNLRESITGEDSFLIESLNKSTSGRLTEIVATIQDQQNKIIRSDGFMPLIVQGVAGSGKTTIALHRMAYLIYNRQQDTTARYMVVAPNKLFLNYIEEILPDLGVDNVVQTTFEDWAVSQLGKGTKLAKEDDKLNTLITKEKEKARIIALAAKLRGSILFKKIIDFKISKIEKQIISHHPIVFEGITLMSQKELQEIFLVSNLHLPLKKRIIQLGEYIKKRLKDKQAFIEASIEAVYQKKITKLKESALDINEVRLEIIRLYDERDAKIKGIKKWIPGYVKDYLKQIELPKTKDFYLGIFEDEEALSRLLIKQISEDDLHQVLAVLKSYYVKGEIETEDLGPLVYTEMKLYGLKEEGKYTHIVVDEAQDLDEMKLTVLREVSANDAFTLVGDLSQGIYDYKGIINWERMMQRVFEGKKYHYYEMTTSYRSTIEIIDLANEVINWCKDFTPIKAQAVLRHGPKPQLIHCKDEKERIDCIAKDIRDFQQEGRVSICVLVKHKMQVHTVCDKLQAIGVKSEKICDQGDHYNGGIVVMPGYLSKGLEFDAVLIYDVSNQEDKVSSLDIKMLYVMITRALHRLKLYSIGRAIDGLEKYL